MHRAEELKELAAHFQDILEDGYVLELREVALGLLVAYVAGEDGRIFVSYFPYEEVMLSDVKREEVVRTGEDHGGVPPFCTVAIHGVSFGVNGPWSWEEVAQVLRQRFRKIDGDDVDWYTAPFRIFLEGQGLCYDELPLAADSHGACLLGCSCQENVVQQVQTDQGMESVFQCTECGIFMKPHKCTVFK